MHISAFQPYAGVKHQRPACARSSPQIHAVARRHPKARQGPQAPSAIPQNATESPSSTADASLASSRAASSPHQLPDAVKASVLENTLHVTSSQQQHSTSTAPSAPPTNMLDGAADSSLIPAGDGPWGRTSAPPPLTSVLPMWRLPRSGDDTNALRPLPGYYSGLQLTF